MKNETSFFICSQCKSLCYTSNSPFTSDILQVNFGNFVSVEYDTPIPCFPICSNCIDMSVKHANRLAGLYRKFISTSTELDGYAKSYLSKCLKVEPTKKYEIDEYNISLESKSPITESKTKPPMHKSIHPLFGQTKIFHISFQGLFGVINQLRIGSLKSNTVPIDEIQMALYLLSRYLVCLLRQYKLSVDGIALACIPQFCGIELKYPEKKSQVKSFNTSLDNLYSHFEQLFGLLSKKGISPPYQIISTHHSIGGIEYLYAWQNPFNFVCCTKRLLINLKTVQVLQSLF